MFASMTTPALASQSDTRYNVHVYPNPITHATRVEKVVRSIAAIASCKILIFGIHESHLPHSERLSQDVVVRRLQLTFGTNTRNTVLKVLQALEFSLLVLIRCRKQRVDVVNVHTLSLLPLGVAFKYLKGASIVYDIHELETEKAQWYGLRRRIARLVEGLLIRHAAQVVVVSPSIADWYSSEYGVECEVILNTPCIAQVMQPQRLFNSLFAIPQDDTLIFLYQGSLSPGRSVPLLLDVFGSSRKHCIVFVGYGEYEGMVRDAASRCRNVFYHPAVPADETLRFTASADVGLALIENVCLSYHYSLPTKFFEYIAAGVPVIASPGVDMKRIVDTYGVGVTLEELSHDALVSVIASLDARSLSTWRSNARAIAHRFTWKEEERKIQRIYSRLLTGKSSH
jgi:glycosyltransferase involved in cell wall biosynthesis